MANRESGLESEKTLELVIWLEEVSQKWKSPPNFRVDSKRLRHLAIICDGNRRAAAIRQLPPFLGHQVGIEVVKEVANCARK